MLEAFFTAGIVNRLIDRRLVALLRGKDVGNAVTLMREHCAGTEHILAGLLPEPMGRD